MKFVSRSEWGARYAKGSGAIAGPIRGVTLHWEGPKMGTFPHTACAGKVRTIERFHAVSRGWSGIAYSAIVCPHGYVFEGRGTGVRSAANGTSSIGGNDQWYAVCYMSGQTDPFTDAAKAGMIDAVRWLRAKGGAGNRVNGHRDHHATECPGNVIYKWLQTANFNAPAQEEDMPLTDAEWARLKGMTEAEGEKTRQFIAGLVGDVVPIDPAAWGEKPGNDKVYVRTALSKIMERLGKSPSQPGQ